EISTPIAAGRENGHIRGKTMDRAVIHVECDHAAATALVVHDQVDRKIFDEEFGCVAQGLSIHRVQHGVAGAIGCSTSALCGALAVMRGHAAEWTLIDFSVLFAA